VRRNPIRSPRGQVIRDSACRRLLQRPDRPAISAPDKISSAGNNPAACSRQGRLKAALAIFESATDLSHPSRNSA
jgi:hypothetical protein